MSTDTFRYSDVVKDYRKAFTKIAEGEYWTITFKKEGIDHKIIRVSIFDSEIDDESKCLPVTSRDFKDNPSFYLNFIRYTLSNIIITVHSKPKWIIEPKLGAVKFMLSQLNLSSREDLKNILLEGHLTNLIGGNPSELRREAKSLEKLKKLADNEKQKVTIENNRLKDKIGVIGRELENLRTKYRIVCNPLL